MFLQVGDIEKQLEGCADETDGGSAFEPKVFAYTATVSPPVVEARNRTTHCCPFDRVEWLYCSIITNQLINNISASEGHDRTSKVCSFVVIYLKATKYAEREQINKSHWLSKVSCTHFTGREFFPKLHFFSFSNISLTLLFSKQF